MTSTGSRSCPRTARRAGAPSAAHCASRKRGFVNDAHDSARNPQSGPGKLFAKSKGFATLNRFFAALTS